MHTKYTTLGLVLERNAQGESNSYFSIFTNEFGKVFASAQAIRETKSKLRMSLDEFSFSEISLVRGKQMWRLTGAKKLFDLYTIFREDKQKLLVAVNVVKLLSRLLHGEEKNESLFKLVFDAFTYFKDNQLSAEEVKNFETVLVLNILHLLGYVGDKEEFKNCINTIFWEKEILNEMAKVRGKALVEINRSLDESQL